MATVTITETQEPQESKDIIIDSKKRRLKIKEPELLERFDLIEIIGNERSSNASYMQMVEPILWIKEIDGDRLEIPVTYLQLRHLLKRIGNSGYFALMQHFRKLREDEAVTDGEADAAKKSQEMNDLSKESI